jgi:hypothetical protein
MTLLPSSIEGLMGLREEHLVSLFPLKGTRRNLDDSPRGWFSEPLDCPPNERCSPEPMVGTMNPLGGNPRPSRAGRKSDKNKSERKNTEPFMKIYSFFKALLYRRVDSKTKHKTSFGVYGTF